MSIDIKSYTESILNQAYPEGTQSYYPEQEMTHTDLSYLDTTQSPLTFEERNPMLRDNNPGVTFDDSFSEPISLDFFQYEKYSPMDNEFLEDPNDLYLSASCSLDSFFKDSSVTIKEACFDLNDFFKTAEEELVHKAKKDIWKVIKDSNGNSEIKRLVDENTVLKE